MIGEWLLCQPAFRRYSLNIVGWVAGWVNVIMKRPICAIGLLSLSLTALGCRGRSGDKALRLGLADLQTGNYSAAVRNLERASRRLPGSATVYYNLGSALYQLGKMDAAEAAFSEALALEPTDLAALEYLGHVQLQKLAWPDARRSFERAATLTNNPAAQLTALSLVELGDGHADLARLRLVQALKHERAYAPALYNLASLYRGRLHMPAEAIDYFEMYLHVAPPDDPHRAKARESIKNLKVSGGSVVPVSAERTVRRDESAAASAFAAAEQARTAGRWTEAITAYHRALAADPLHYAAAYNLGFACRSSGDLSGAIRAFQKAADIKPFVVEAVFMLATVAFEYRNYPLASQTLDQALVRWPSYAPAYELMARIRFAQQRPAEARAYGEYYVQLAPPGASRDRFAQWVRTLPER